jgi:hypothetical protein
LASAKGSRRENPNGIEPRRLPITLVSELLLRVIGAGRKSTRQIGDLIDQPSEDFSHPA